MNDRPVVALTGATGFIGKTLCQKLVEAGYLVRALYRPRTGRQVMNTSDVEWVPGGLDDTDSLTRLVTGTIAVVHCAGAVRGASRAAFDLTNVVGVRNIARVTEAQDSCGRMVLVSSLAARQPELSDYAGSKHRGEQVMAQETSRVSWVAIRPPAVYGPGDKEMLPLFRTMAKGYAPIPGAGKGRFSLIHVDDLAEAIVCCVSAENVNRQIYELDDGHEGGYSWDEILSTVVRVAKRSAPVRRIHVPVHLLQAVAGINLMAARVFGYSPMLTPGKVRELTHEDWVCDSRSLIKATGWYPRVGFERGLASVLNENSLG